MIAIARTRDAECAFAAEVIDLVQLPLRARPLPRVELEFDEVQRSRSLECESYNACLAFVVRLGWPSFHCKHCPKFRSSVMSDQDAATHRDEQARVIPLW